MPNGTLPSSIDLGGLVCDTGYFLPRDVALVPFEDQPTPGTWRFCSTFRDSPTTLRDSVLELVRSARHKIFVTSFILGDDALAAELIAAADRLTGGVYVIPELSEASLRRGLSTLEEISERGKKATAKVEVEKKRFMSLTRQGVAVRGHENCHAQFLVVDDATAWVGSANLETRAFTEVGEVGVVTSDPVEVDRLARLFARMWLAGTKWELPATDEYSVRPREGGTCTITVPPPPSGGPSLIWTDSDDESLLTAVHDVIGKAERELLLASYLLDGMVKRPDLLLDPIAKAIEKGVEVTMLVRTLNYRERHRQDAAVLHNLGVRLLADKYNHAKAVVADGGTSGALFSANFDAKHGLDAGSGLEIGARLDNTPALANLTSYLRHALATADFEFVRNPAQRQLDHPKVLGKSRVWPLPAKLDVHAAPEDWRALAHEATQGPVLWSRAEADAIELHIGTNTWPLRPAPINRFRLGPRRPIEQKIAHRDRDASFGYCSATLIYAGT
jgi:cardiolipin synthase A/B